MPNYDTRPPFSKRIMEETILRQFKIPQVEPYDGTIDLFDHMDSFKAHMMIQNASDILYCLAFLATLKKVAQMWYLGIPAGMIHSFSQFEKIFLSYFRTSWRITQNSDSLFLIQQRDDEDPRDFIA